jgi:uncharacterized protein
MQWRGRQGSGNIEDRRGVSGGGMAIGGGVGGVVILIIYLLLGGDPSQTTELLPGQRPSTSLSAADKAEQDTLAQFVSVVLRDTEDVWGNLLNDYRQPRLVLFSDAVQSACGQASAAVGPFYCPGDQKVYIDLSFFKDLRQRFGAPGDFAMAYVIAHEVGHHIQNLQGTSEKMHAMRSRLSEKEYNRLSVKLELQADFLAGVWAHHAQEMKGILDKGDIEEALTAANAIGDDKLQQEARGRVVPDAFTHGTSAQRMYWFKKGFDTGDLQQGNTFEARDL